MADHFYGKLGGKADNMSDSTVIVGTSTAGSTYIEVRVPDGIATLRRRDVGAILRHIARYIESVPSVAILK